MFKERPRTKTKIRDFSATQFSGALPEGQCSAAFSPRSRGSIGSMALELGTRGQRDRFRVNIADADEFHAWCAEFGCTPVQLKQAVGRAGVMASDVAAFLGLEAASPRRRPLWTAWLRLRRRHPSR